MIWAGIGYDAKAPLIFVKAGVRVNTDTYRREILRPVESWATEYYGLEEDGKVLSLSCGKSVHLQVIEMTGLSSRMELLRTQAPMKSLINSGFRRRDGSTNTSQTLSERKNGRRHLLTWTHLIIRSRTSFKAKQMLRHTLLLNHWSKLTPGLSTISIKRLSTERPMTGPDVWMQLLTRGADILNEDVVTIEFQ